jgi:signal transduction histidine kinase
MNVNLSSPQDAQNSGGPGFPRADSSEEEALLEAVDREGRRIGQELHDHLSQILLGAALSAKAMAMGLPRDSAMAAQVEDLARLINSAVQETRNAVRSLHPGQLDAADLVPALEEFLKRPKAGIACRLESTGTARVGDAQTAFHAYRIVQEAVDNAVRHSGATEIVVRFRDDERNVVLEIEDNGRGFDIVAEGRAGIGMEMMERRARAMAAKFSVDTSPTSGTRVILLIPK